MTVGTPATFHSNGHDNDAPWWGINHNNRTHFALSKIGLGRIALKYLLFFLPPLMALVAVLFLQVYPLKLLWDHRAVFFALIRRVCGISGIDETSDERLSFLVIASTAMLPFVSSLFLRQEKTKVHPPHDGPPKRVCIIGAGISGILTAKECLEEAHDVTVLERSWQQGGVWRNRAWEKTMLTSSNMNTSFSDFIFPELFTSNEHVGFATRDQFVSYIDAYTAHFKVGAVIRFGCEVVEVTKGDECYTVRWNKMDSSGRLVSTEQQDFDAVAVCTGQPNVPRPCPLEDIEKFEGTVSHSKTYTDPEPFRGKRVLVVGTGESASDIVAEIAGVSSEPVAISQHSPTLVLHRDHYESPPDYAENRLLHLCPAATRWAYLKVLFLQIVFFGDLTTRLRKMPKPFTWLRFLVFYKVPIDVCQPTAVCSTVHVTKSGCMLAPISSGTAVQCPAAVRFTGGKTIEFEDGTTADYDHVVLANGYLPPRFPFLEKLGIQDSTDDQRYHLTFEPNYPNIAFVGFTRGQLGALTILMEMQARWFALIVSGRRRLPSSAAMQKRVISVKAQTRGKYMTRASWFAANYIARNEVLCEPNLLPLFLTRPFLAWKILTRSFASWQFRLNGPGAKKDLALAAYESVQLRTNIPGESIHRALMVLTCIVSHLTWSILRLLPLPSSLIVLLNGLFMPNTCEIY